MITITLFFHGELGDYFPELKTGELFHVRILGHGPIPRLIQFSGIPHPEIGTRS